jgi:hypothetical protein
MGGGVTWWQNWTTFPDLSLDGGSYPIEYVPTIWNANFTVANVEAQIPQGARYLLTFYLPNVIKDQDGKSQSDVSVPDAIAVWPKIQMIANDLHLKIVSPSVDYCDSTKETCLEANPIVWMQDFVDKCPSCQFDYLGVSSQRCDVPSLNSDLALYKTTFPGKPLWLTSFGCTDTSIDPALLQQFMLSAVSNLELDPQVFRYGWFTGFSNAGDAGIAPYSLLQGPGSDVLTPLGMAYVGAMAP